LGDGARRTFKRLIGLQAPIQTNQTYSTKRVRRASSQSRRRCSFGPAHYGRTQPIQLSLTGVQNDFVSTFNSPPVILHDGCLSGTKWQWPCCVDSFFCEITANTVRRVDGVEDFPQAAVCLHSRHDWRRRRFSDRRSQARLKRISAHSGEVATESTLLAATRLYDHSYRNTRTPPLSSRVSFVIRWRDEWWRLCLRASHRWRLMRIHETIAPYSLACVSYHRNVRQAIQTGGNIVRVGSFCKETFSTVQPDVLRPGMFREDFPSEWVFFVL